MSIVIKNPFISQGICYNCGDQAYYAFPDGLITNEDVICGVCHRPAVVLLVYQEYMLRQNRYGATKYVEY